MSYCNPWHYFLFLWIKKPILCMPIYTLTVNIHSNLNIYFHQTFHANHLLKTCISHLHYNIHFLYFSTCKSPHHMIQTLPHVHPNIDHAYTTYMQHPIYTLPPIPPSLYRSPLIFTIFPTWPYLKNSLVFTSHAINLCLLSTPMD